VAFRPDGKRLASASSDQTVKIWDVEKGQVLFTLTGQLYDFATIAYSPDGKRLATGYGDKTIKLWDADQGGPALATFQGHTQFIFSVAFSPDGKYLASGGLDGTVRLWDARTGQEVRPLSKGGLTRQLAFSPDGTQLVLGGDGGVLLQDVRTGRVTRTFHKDAISGVAFSRDGRRLAAGGRDGAVKVWEVETGRPLQTPAGHFGIISQLAGSPDQRFLASSSYDRTVRLWDLETGRELCSLEHPWLVYGVAWNPDGESLYSHAGEVRRWNARTGGLIGTIPVKGSGSVFRVAIRPGSQQLAAGLVQPGSGETTVKVLDSRTGTELHTLPVEFKVASGDRLDALTYSPDGKLLALVLYDGVAKVWDADSEQEVCTLKKLAVMRRWSLAISPDGKRLALPGTPTTVSVRDLPTGEEIDALLLPNSRTVAYSSDGRLLAAGSETGKLIVFDTASGKPAKEWQLPGEFRSLLFDATSRYLLTGNSNGTIYVLRLNPPPGK